MSELVPVPGVVLERLRALGVDVARLLRQAGLARSRFVDVRAKLTVPEFFAFWRALEAVGGSRELGIQLGARVEPYQLDVASLAAIHAETLADGLAKFARYKRLVCGEAVSVKTVKDEARIQFHWLHVEEALPQMLVDSTFATLLALARKGIGEPVKPRRVELARRRADVAMMQAAFACPIRFDAPSDVLVFDAALLERPFVTRNADVLALMVPALEAELAAETSGKDSIARDVRAVLRRRMAGERPSVAQTARDLGMSPRTLQRRLEGHGTSYQALLDEVRHDSARRLLAETELDAGEIAFLLGFEELNSFSRAFQAWEGATPLRWRTQAARAR